MYSKLYNATIQSQKVIITAQRTKNDTYGNPRYAVQVWSQHGDSGSLWTPHIKGYRLNKQDQYIIQSYNLDDDMAHFIQAFEEAIKA